MKHSRIPATAHGPRDSPTFTGHGHSLALLGPASIADPLESPGDVGILKCLPNPFHIRPKGLQGAQCSVVVPASASANLLSPHEATNHGLIKGSATFNVGSCAEATRMIEGGVATAIGVHPRPIPRVSVHRDTSRPEPVQHLHHELDRNRCRRNLAARRRTVTRILVPPVVGHNRRQVFGRLPLAYDPP